MELHIIDIFHKVYRWNYGVFQGDSMYVCIYTEVESAVSYKFEVYR